MKDRVSTYPGRVALAPVPGQANVYDMTMADQPTQAGDPPTKANLLSDETETALCGSANNRTVNEALGAVAETLRILGACDVSKAFVVLTLTDGSGKPLQNVSITGTKVGPTDSKGMFAFEMTPGAFQLSLAYPLGYSGPTSISGTSKGGERTVINRSDCAVHMSGSLEILTSKTLYLAPFIKRVDLFAVGGGGGGRGARDHCGNSTFSGAAGGGGGGGLTDTLLALELLSGKAALVVSVGAGGSPGRAGGMTTATYNGVVVASAGGGSEGKNYSGIGGAGGSGGGAASKRLNSSGAALPPTSGAGGSNGGDGTSVTNESGSGTEPGGIGQHATTRAFGEASGKLYAGGGGGAAAITFNNQSYDYVSESTGGAGGGGSGRAYATPYRGNDTVSVNGQSGTDGLGGGGGAGAGAYVSSDPATVNGGRGGSGALVLRWNAG